jgi:histidine triad (HIT) family protein
MGSMKHKNKSDCPFCRKIDRPTTIYQDDLVFAIISLRPINSYHVIVIPHEHYEDFVDLPDNLAAHIFIVAKKISKAIRETCHPDAITHLSDDDIRRKGDNLLTHYKFHLVPRFDNDDVEISWNRTKDPGIIIRTKSAEEIKKNLH